MSHLAVSAGNNARRLLQRHLLFVESNKLALSPQSLPSLVLVDASSQHLLGTAISDITALRSST